MGDIERALAEITNIRGQLAAGTLFRGYGPAVVALTGLLAFATGLLQTLWPERFAADAAGYILCWLVVAIASGALIGTEMIARSRRLHGGMADAMLLTAVEQFLPAGLAGAAVTGVVLKYAPDSLWMLPGLWQILVGVGVFASLRTLPRAIGLAGGWYLLAGVTVLIIASANRDLPPIAMAAPFGIGQLLVAAILRKAEGETHAE